MKTKFIFIFAIFLSLFFYHQVFADSIAVNLDIEGATSTIFNGVISVEPCSPDGSSASTLNAYCAIIQSSATSTWSLSGTDEFLDSVNGEGNDYTNNIYWGWFSNLEYGETALNKHILSAGENIIVTLERMPLNISLSTTTPEVESTTTISITQFGFDSSWNGVFTAATSSSLEIEGNIFPVDGNGNFYFVPTSTDPVEIKAAENGFLDSQTVVLNPIESAPPTVTPSAEPSSASLYGSGGGGISHHSMDVNAAFQFLEMNENQDGSFDSSLYTDWAAVAFGAGPENSYRDKIANYEKSAPDNSVSATDYERHAMAIMALGINPYTGTDTNYIQKIINEFDGTQIGDPSLINDDIFAIFPLMKAGYSSNDTIIQKVIANIISRQNSDGSWQGGADMTAAAIQALSMTPSLAGVSGALSKARAYLSGAEQSNGGFGSSFTTSWVLQAISALGESGTNWLSGGYNPYDYLYNQEQSDGGIDSMSENLDTRIWATVYAIPAALGKPWASILSSFSKPVVATISLTTTEAFATTTNQTIEISTSTNATSSAIAAPKSVSLPVVEKKFIPVLSVKQKTVEASSTPTKQKEIAPSQMAAVAAIPYNGFIQTALTAVSALTAIGGIFFLIII